MRKDTECVRAGYTPGNGEPRQLPIIQSTTFRYTTSEEMGAAKTTRLYTPYGPAFANLDTLKEALDAVEHAAPLFEEAEQFGFRDGGRRRALHQLAVVAERAAEVAPGQKHRARHAPRPVEQRQLLQSLHVHMRAPFAVSCCGSVSSIPPGGDGCKGRRGR